MEKPIWRSTKLFSNIYGCANNWHKYPWPVNICQTPDIGGPKTWLDRLARLRSCLSEASRYRPVHPVELATTRPSYIYHTGAAKTVRSVLYNIQGSRPYKPPMCTGIFQWTNCDPNCNLPGPLDQHQDDLSHCNTYVSHGTRGHAYFRIPAHTDTFVPYTMSPIVPGTVQRLHLIQNTAWVNVQLGMVAQTHL